MNYRHGDMALIGVKEVPNGLKKSDSKILMIGSGGNGHSFNNGEFYPHKKDNFVFGYLVAKDTSLFHKEHGKTVKGQELRVSKIKDGIYELRNQFEHTNAGMKKVVD